MCKIISKKYHFVLLLIAQILSKFQKKHTIVQYALKNIALPVKYLI